MRVGEQPGMVIEALLEAYFRPDWEELERLYAEDKAMLSAVRDEREKLHISNVP